MFKGNWRDNFDIFWSKNESNIVRLHNLISVDYVKDEEITDQEHEEFVLLMLTWCVFNDCEVDEEKFFNEVANYEFNQDFCNLFGLLEVALTLASLEDEGFVVKNNDNKYVLTLEAYEALNKK